MSNFNIGIFNVPVPMTNFEALSYCHESGFAAFEPYPQYDLAQPDREAAIRIRDEAKRLGIHMPCFSTLANWMRSGVRSGPRR